jgi:Fe-S cluster assembly iron-binding protein IscA
VKVLIDPKALMHVIGTKMDYVDDPLKYGPLLHSGSSFFYFVCSPCS